MSEREILKLIKDNIGNVFIEDLRETKHGVVAIYYGGQPLLVSNGKIRGLNPNYAPDIAIIKEAANARQNKL